MFPAVNRSGLTRIFLDIFMGVNRINTPCTINSIILKAILDYEEISMIISNLKSKNKPTPVLSKKVLLVLIAAGILGYNIKKANTTAVIADKSISKYKPIEGHLVFTCNVNG